MLTETTITKLREMRLSVMANALKDQLEESQYNSMAFEDRLGLIVDAEWNARKSNHLQRLIRQARAPVSPDRAKRPVRRAARARGKPAERRPA